MLRIIFALVLLLHGLFHLMGFAKAYRYAEITQLSGEYSRSAGFFWLLSALLFTASVLFFFLKKDWWWMAALPAVLISQMLLFGQWKDARFGTIANVIILVGVVLAYGQWKWNGMLREEVKSFQPANLPESSILTKEMIAGLPPVVQKWMERSQVIGKKMVQQVEVTQSGRMRAQPGGNWMPLTATQYFTISKPGFIWMADMEAAPFVTVKGRDLYQDGKGHMFVKAMALFPVADARGAATDQGSMLRYLAEICWFPSAALNSFIQWEPVDARSAKAIMRYGAVEGSGIFTFDENGDIRSFDALRYYERKGGATLEKWHIDMDPAGFKTFDGVRIPAKSSVTWKLATGDFLWLELEILNRSER